jgi:hypothetical protein
MPETKPDTIAQTKPRLQVYSSVARQAELEPTRSVYYRQRDLIISSSVTRWAQRTDRDPDEAIKAEAISLYERDKEVALKYQQGVIIAGKTIFLNDLIAETKERLKKLKAKPLI